MTTNSPLPQIDVVCTAFFHTHVRITGTGRIDWPKFLGGFDLCALSDTMMTVSDRRRYFLKKSRNPRCRRDLTLDKIFYVMQLSHVGGIAWSTLSQSTLVLFLPHLLIPLLNHTLFVFSFKKINKLISSLYIN